MIETGDDDGHDHAEDPDAEGVDRHVGVVSVGDGGPDLWVGRVLLDIAQVGAVEVRISKVGISDLFDDMVCNCLAQVL